jgi:1-aminocyclopropane-1-carboxylate deaminase/D-cysteine desulfhydrase-like pyridoxal-dependent ACC family enzyme
MPSDSPFTRRSLLEALAAVPIVPLGHYPTPVEEMSRLRSALGGGPRLLVKRDDAVAFGMGGNKVRKLEFVAARALEEGADTLITCGGVQSNHARVTAAAAAKLGLKCVIVANGTRPERPTGNALLDQLLGAEVDYVTSREERAPRMRVIAGRLRREGGRPFEIPLGASIPLGALGFVRAVGELVAEGTVPDVIVHATSSGGTQAGLVAGCMVHDLATRIIGVSADDPAEAIAATVGHLVRQIGVLLGAAPGDWRVPAIDVDDGFVGGGYGVPTPASTEASELVARTEALFVEHWYTAKALAGLIAYVRQERFKDDQTVLFWHTGGHPMLFA